MASPPSLTQPLESLRTQESSMIRTKNYPLVFALTLSLTWIVLHIVWRYVSESELPFFTALISGVVMFVVSFLVGRAISPPNRSSDPQKTEEDEP